MLAMTAAIFSGVDPRSSPESLARVVGPDDAVGPKRFRFLEFFDGGDKRIVEKLFSSWSRGDPKSLLQGCDVGIAHTGQQHLAPARDIEALSVRPAAGPHARQQRLELQELVLRGLKGAQRVTGFGAPATRVARLRHR